MDWEIKKQIIQKYGSQEAFALESEISGALVSRIIHGHKRLTPAMRERWERLGIDCSPIGQPAPPSQKSQARDRGRGGG